MIKNQLVPIIRRFQLPGRRNYGFLHTFLEIMNIDKADGRKLTVQMFLSGPTCGLLNLQIQSIPRLNS